MQNWLRRFRGPVGMVLAWTVAGALVGALIEWGNDAVSGSLPLGSLVDVWPPVLALVGFLGGVVYAAGRGFAGSRRMQ